MANTLENLREVVMKEIDGISKKGELDDHTLDCIDTLVDVLKDINEIEMGEEGYSMRYSQYPYAMAGNSYGNSYARQSRDSMGRYSRDNSYGNSYRGGYSRDGEREEIMAKMGRMMDNATSETERQAIQRVMNQM